MIERINLIEKQPFSFTYGRLLQICGFVMLLGVALVGWGHYQLSAIEPVVKQKKMRLQELKAEKKELEKKPKLKKRTIVKVGEYQELFDVLKAYPQWAIVLDEVTYNLPNSVWLTEVFSQNVGQKKTEPKKRKKKEADEEEEPATFALHIPDQIQLTLNGLAVDVDTLSSFVNKLEKSPYFLRTVIKESQKQAFGYQFSVVTYVNKDYVE